MTHPIPSGIRTPATLIWPLLMLVVIQARAAPLPDPLGWRLGPAAWSFNRFTFFEAVDKTAALGLRYIEAFEGQRIRGDLQAKMGADLSDEEIAQVQTKLASSGVKLTSIYIHALPGEETSCRKTLEFCRKLGIETVISEPAPESFDLIEKLCDEYRINVAIHNHPKGSSRYWHPQEALKVCEGRSPRLGVCADVGHWQRSGLKPVDGVRLLGKRLLTLHVKDLSELTPNGHDVPWGTGVGEIAGLLREIRRIGVKPTLFAIEYEHNWDNNSSEIDRSAEFFKKTVAELAEAGSSTPAKAFRAGAHQVDISPERFPVIVNAMFTERSATGVVDRLCAKALVLDDGQTRVALCVVDTCLMPRDLIDRAKDIATKATGIPTERMCISATHTHSAPSVLACLGSRVDLDYAASLPPKIADAIVGAARNLTSARIGWAVVDDWAHTFNRRWIRRPDRMITDPFGQRNVRAHMHPGHESPDAVGPSGPVDPGLSVLAVQSLDGAPLALFANYSQHYYESPLLSSDYYGRFARHIAKMLGAEKGSPPFVGIMSQGTSGDLMWMDYGSPRRAIGYDAYAREVAERALEAYRRIEWHDWAPLRMVERKLPLRYRVPDEERLAWARQMVESLTNRLPQTLPEIYAGEAIQLHERQKAELKLQALRIGDLGIAALPNEAFAITGLKLKAQSPLQPTFNIELANGAEGYIPPPEQHKLGGYTTWPARSAGLEVQAEPRIVETMLGLLEDVAGKPRRTLAEEHGPYAQTVLAAKPLAYWRLNETVIPTAYDASGSGHHAIYEDGVALFLPGVGSGTGRLPAPKLAPSNHSGSQINRAAHFAGGRVRASVPNLGDRYSVELWLWNGLPHDARAVTGYFFSRGPDGDKLARGDHLGIGGAYRTNEIGRLILFDGNERNESLVGRTPLKLRTWHHVVLVRDTRKVAAYLDGQLDLGGELESAAPAGEASLFLGGRCDNFANFEGKLDEVALYDRPLSSAEAAAHFKASSLSAPATASVNR
jgi:sugar phosphate isomerase/epimerase